MNNIAVGYKRINGYIEFVAQIDDTHPQATMAMEYYLNSGCAIEEKSASDKNCD